MQLTASPPPTYQPKLPPLFFKPCRRALPVDFLTEWQAIWAVVLAFFGGFMGIILALAGGIEVSAAGATRAEVRERLIPLVQTVTHTGSHSCWCSDI